MAGGVPRIARLIALAIRFDQLIRDGVVADQAELARLGKISRARVTQILNLLSLAPDIQAAILEMSYKDQNRLTERQFRIAESTFYWTAQRQSLKQIFS